MNALFLIILGLFAFGCDQKPAVRHYTEATTPEPAETVIASVPHAGMGAADPHAGMDMSGPHAGLNRADPHAGIDMSDPHAGLGLNIPMMGGKGGDMGSGMGSGAGLPTANDAMRGQMAWDTPKGWTSIDGGGVMRLATLKSAADPKAFDCSIISLPGVAGGLESNIRRWMGQVQLDVTDAQFTKFMSDSKGNIFDFSSLQKNADPSAPSMIAAVLELKGNSVFIKFLGTVNSVGQNRSAFMALVKSVRIKQ